ncbi:MAG: pirin-like C-terminal cupin domain-containing protein [Hyphomonadaceae bacterium]|nr:pirin-like C-terminal cupin domain-containing protein [Hyphomonadaceae bacterium]
MTQRTISARVRPSRHRHGPGLTTTDLSADVVGQPLDPFIVVSLYDMAGPTFPPHPHAGFSVATYILPESPVGFVNHDTLGNRNRIAPGALHVTVAGSGVQHEEQPERTGALARGFQIWIDHAADQREIAPHALHLRAEEAPVVVRDGARARVVLGGSQGATSPLLTPTPVRLIDVSLDRGAAYAQDLLRGETAFLVVHAGAVSIAGVRVEAGEVATTSTDGDELVVQAHETAARFTLFAGMPLHEKRVQRGPFVAADVQQLQRFVGTFERTGFGRLTPFAAQPDWAPNDGQTIP